MMNRLLIIFLSVFILFPLSSYSDTFIVENLRDSGPGSLRNAILLSNLSPLVDDRIVFSDNITGVIPTDAAILNTFTGEMEITDDVEIIGPGNDLIIIDGQMVDRLLNISSILNINVTISGLKFIGGDTASEGGAIFNTEDLLIDDCVFEQNSAELGGAIYSSGMLTVESTIFDSNNAPQGGLNTGNGGAIYNDDMAVLRDSRFDGNTSDIDGGAIYNSSTGIIEDILRTTFENNQTNINGGSIYSEGEIERIFRSTFDSNTSFGNTGGIYNTGDGQIGTITLSLFNNNFADESGGGIFNDSDSAIGLITLCTFSGNSNDDDDGGAIFNKGTIDKISLNTFDGNSTQDGKGGAIGNEGEITDLSLSTFSGNSSSPAQGFGGAIFNSGTINIAFITVVNNQSTQGGGIANGVFGTMNIKNTIVANNSPDNCNVSLGFNVSGVNFSTDSSCPGFIEVGADSLDLDPQGLTDNGGETLTIALLPTSPAVNAVGSLSCTDHQVTPQPVTKDQRGISRPQGKRCDAGAFELEAGKIISSVPALSVLGFIALAVLLGIIGVVVIRKRKTIM